MPLAFPSNPVSGQVYQNWWWDGTKWMSRARSAPQCGRFLLLGSSPQNTVQFVPYNGDLIKINGSICQIPAAGIVATATSCYINGVLGALAAATFYYVYAWMNGGTMALDFSTTGYPPAGSTTPGNVGVIIKSGDDTRTLVGIATTNAAAPFFNDDFTSRRVRSWFNRQPLALYNSWSGSGVGSGETPLCTIGSSVFTSESFYAQSTFTISSLVQQVVYLDHIGDGNGSTIIIRATPHTDVGIFHCTTPCSAWGPLAAGWHFLQPAIWAQQQVVSSSSVVVVGQVF